MKWWIATNVGSDKLFYVKKTHAQMVGLFNNSRMSNYIVVRPEFKMCPLKYRMHNAKQMDFIEKAHEIQIRQFKDMNVPQEVLDSSDSMGCFCSDPSQFFDEVGLTKERIKSPKNVAKLNVGNRLEALSLKLGLGKNPSNKDMENILIANLIED